MGDAPPEPELSLPVLLNEARSLHGQLLVVVAMLEDLYGIPRGDTEADDR